MSAEANGPWTSEHLQNWLTDAHSLLLKSLPSYASECCLQVDEVNNVAPLPDVLVALHWRDVVGAPTQCELFGCCKQISIVNGTEQETDSGTDEALSIIRGRFEKEKVSSVWILTGRVVVALKHQSPDDQVQVRPSSAVDAYCSNDHADIVSRLCLRMRYHLFAIYSEVVSLCQSTYKAL